MSGVPVLSTDHLRSRGRNQSTVHPLQSHLCCLLRHAFRDSVLDDLCIRAGALLQPPPPRVRAGAALPLPQVLLRQLGALRSHAPALPHPPSSGGTGRDATADVDPSSLLRERVLRSSLRRPRPPRSPRRTHGPGRRGRSGAGSRLPRPRSSGPLPPLQPGEPALQEVPRSVRVRKHSLHGLQHIAPVFLIDETQSSSDVITH